MSAPRYVAKSGRRRQAVRVLAQHWRLWASLPPSVAALVIQSRNGRGRLHISTVARPAFPAGVCRRCGCTEHDPCVDAIGLCCAWTSATRDRCDFCRSGVKRRSRNGGR